MIIFNGNDYQALCDDCGYGCNYSAKSHADAWAKMKLDGWCISRGDVNRIHICHHCPPEIEDATQDQTTTDHN